MADSFTTNYNFVKPAVGGSDDTWGTKLIANWDDADAAIKARQNEAAAAQSTADAVTGRALSAGDGLSGGGDLSANRTFSVNSSVVRTSRTLTAGDGLSGGGDLSDNRTVSVDGTVVRASRTITAGDGLSGGGDLSANRTLSVSSSINAGDGLSGGGQLSSSRSLAVDNTVVRTSRSLSAGSGLTGGGNLSGNRTFSLGTPSTLSGGTSNNTTSGSHTHAISSTTSRSNSSSSTLLAAAGMNNHRTSGDHDGRYAQRGNNLSDLSNAGSARSNLGLGSVATLTHASAVVTLGGDFDSGVQVRCERIGNLVTITSIGSLEHSFDSTANSSSGAIPSQFRPTDEARVCAGRNFNGTFAMDLLVFSNGLLQVQHYDSNFDDKAVGGGSLSSLNATISYLKT